MASIGDFLPSAIRMTSIARILVYLSCTVRVIYGDVLIPLGYQSDEASLYENIGCIVECIRHNEVIWGKILRVFLG